MSETHNRAFQPETPVLPGLKKVGHVDLTRYERKTKVETPESEENAKVETLKPRKNYWVRPLSQNLGSVMREQIGVFSPNPDF